MTQRQSDQNSYMANHNGIALVIVLLALAIITAMVVEFSYAVYTGTNDLYNWRDGQRLSIMARSGIKVTLKLLPYMLAEQKYSQGVMERPIENPFEDFNGTITVRVEDERSKFNINSLVYSQLNKRNDDAYASFKRLLGVLSLNEKIADRIIEWIQRERESGISMSGASSKYYRLRSVDELILIAGIDREAYDKLLPYITVYGPNDEFAVNVNGAGKPVLMSISDPRDGTFPITSAQADRIIKYRESNPFLSWGDFNNFAGTKFSTDRIKTLGTDFSIKATAASGGVKRIIEAVLDNSASKIEYWKEY